jgi:two-component system, NarL family, nitrate/nitrite response regulator NarL
LPRARVLLAEDNAMVAEQIRQVLEEAHEVVGVVGTGEELESAFEFLTPEVVVTDIMMPGEGGLVAARHILERYPGTPVVLLSVIDSISMMRAGFLCGIHGYVVKEDAADELNQAVDAALAGNEYISTAGRRTLPTGK